MSSSDDQPRWALTKHANPVRLQRAELRRRIRDAPDRYQSRCRMAALLRDPPAVIAGMFALSLLKWTPGIGDGNAERLLGIADVRNLGITVGRLTERQRRLLAWLLVSPPTAVREAEDAQLARLFRHRPDA